MFSQRDQNIKDFLVKFKVAKTSTIAELFFPSIRMAQYRLKTLCKDYKEINRYREHISDEYVYYVGKKPKHPKHPLLLTDFYRELHKIATIKPDYFIPEYRIEHLIADGLVGYNYQGENYFACIEVQTRNEEVDLDKYKKLYTSKRYLKYFPTFPQIIVITDPPIRAKTDFPVIQLKTKIDISKLVEYLSP